MRYRDEASVPVPVWRDAAMIARQLREGEERPPGRRKGQPAGRRRRGWLTKPHINKTYVKRVVDDQHPLPDLSRAESVLVAQQLKGRGFSARRTAERLGVSERTVYRMLKTVPKQERQADHCEEVPDHSGPGHHAGAVRL